MTRPTFLCIGCGKRPVRRHWAYCDTCKARFRKGYVSIDVDDLPSEDECERAIRAMDAFLRTVTT